MSPSEGLARNLVFSLAVNYNAEALAPFVRSCRRNVPDSDIVLFVAGLSPDTRSWLAEQGVMAIDAELNAYGGGSGVRAAIYHFGVALGVGVATRMGAWASGGRWDAGPHIRQAALNMVCQRYFLYRSYLRASGEKYAGVFLADCRDTVFQRSPFPCSGLHVFAENSRVGESHFGKRWYQLGHGHRAWKRHADQPFLCSGATLGDRISIETYLGAMCASLSQVLATNNGTDQATHNFIVHEGLVSAEIHPFGSGPVVNLNAAPLDHLRLDDGRLLNAQGEPFAAVHQYDRVSGLRIRDMA